jgi:hypothetical protein
MILQSIHEAGIFLFCTLIKYKLIDKKFIIVENPSLLKAYKSTYY